MDNIEQLKEYRKKLSMLSEEEKKFRDLYLKKLSEGSLQGPMTGFPSLDKTWLKYYELQQQHINYREKTAYQCLYDNNINHPNDLAIEFFGAKITFGQLLDNISKAAKSFEANGIKKGDFVTICAPGIPETVYSFYALSKIGAVSNMFANHFDKDNFVDRIYDCKSKILIVMDQFYDEIKDAVNSSMIEKVIVIPTLNSSPLRFIGKKYKINASNHEIYWNQFIKEGNFQKDSTTVRYEKNMPLVMVYSSGTTGASKGILLSNDSFQNSIDSYFSSGLDLNRGQKFYQIIPTWYSTGISTSVHLPLSCGASVYMDPRFEREIFAKNIVKAKPNYCIAPTSMYEGLLDSKLMKNKDLSFFRNAFEGGEPLSEDLAKKINDVFIKHGNLSSIKVGYGQCECGATITTQTDNTDHCNGSVGIPLPGINLRICDDYFDEVKIKNRGQIVAQTPCSMIEYYKNPVATKNYFFIDESGNKWNCTGDIGYIDNNGQLYIEGRASDYSIINGEKIYNFDIEKIINMVDEIKLCDVLPIIDERNNNILIAHLILEEEIENLSNKMEILKEIQDRIYSLTGDINMIPELFKFWKEFPYAKSGKRDTFKMQQDKEDFMYIKYKVKEKQFIK